MTNPKVLYEIQTFTLCDGWINTWRIIDEDNTETLETFATEAEARHALDEFLREIQEEIDAGHLSPDGGYSPDDYRIVPVTPCCDNVNMLPGEY